MNLEFIIIVTQPTTTTAASCKLVKDVTHYSVASIAPLVKEEHKRYTCPACCKSRCLYCPQCCTWLDSVAPAVPLVQLPIPIVIIKHPGELVTKSTAIHAKLLAPNDVDIRDWEDPECTADFSSSEDGDNVDYLLFPSSKTSVPVSAAYRHIRRLVVIDGTWVQAKKIVRETPALRHLPAVHLLDYATLFWRYQTGLPRHYLATIEAIAFFFREFNDAKAAADAGSTNNSISNCDKKSTTDNTDNLLWLFVYNLDRVQRHYAKHPPTAKISRHQLEHLCKTFLPLQT